ncbi:MAG: peptide MFS transporter [Sphingobacteriales bacterium]|jgi:POT family proton-dependent oligopeptide transporter|nr:peptide MFS transporter [Sphingobacteriales bacterium]MBP9142597.1 peptide MFS transporter [Chitinophagales bacterium]MDA0199502.1 peptide MFS transporter [Bacteroidota bacterium]MBK7526523.1 peptide MFS transporter [Sphingobacteriales bacterium]MBK8679905.1 peptide MFS transporter [Sphingobacteriales bacterium]
MKHPRQLWILFFAEMWERFSFYGMKALLILYMTKVLLYEKSDASLIQGAYMSLVYVMPMFGGLLADRILGYRKAVIFGGITMAVGHFVLAFSSEWAFYLGMAFIVCGNGFFKPNISTMVGTLYEQGDPRRDAGFSIFYMGINLGAFLGGLICGYIGEIYSWHWGFGLAGILMLAGLAVFTTNQHSLGERGLPPENSTLNKPIYGLSTERVIYLLSFLCVPFFALLIYKKEIMDFVMPTLVIAAIGYVAYHIKQLGGTVGQKLMAALILIVSSAMFWGFYEMGGGVINLFADDCVNRTFGGFTFPAASLNNAINPFFIVLLSPVFAWLWVWLNKHNAEPTTARKFGLSFLQLFIGFGLFWSGISLFSNAQGLEPFLFYALAYLFLSTAELCISPIGLSMVTKLSPAHMTGRMMGIWFLFSAAGQYIAGFLGSIIKFEEGCSGYTYVFKNVAYVCIGFGVLMLLIAPTIRKWMHDIR